MTLHLIQIELDWSLVLQNASQLRAGTDPGYHLHAWLAGVFGPGVLQPFRWMERRGVLYGYSKESEDGLLARADQFADPKARSAIRMLASKGMPKTWSTDTRAGFSLRVAPTVRLSSAVEGRAPKGAEVDAYLAARWRSEEEAPTRAVVYERWVAGQLSRHGDVQLEQFEIEKHRLAKIVRRDQRGRRRAVALTLPDVECTGVLRVRDADRFHHLLERGVGRHRAFGFGMLLLRPPPC